MTPEVEKFLDAATSPLKGMPEARDEVRTELMGRISHQGGPLELVDLSRETAALENAPKRSPQIRRFGLLAALIVLFGLMVAGVSFRVLELVRLSQAQRGSMYYGGFTESSKLQKQSMLDGWAEREAPDLLLTGDASKYRSLRDETRDLRKRFPEDLAVLQEHLSRQRTQAMRFMSEEERALIERLDPDNALWPLMEFKWWLDKANGRDRGTYGGRGSVSTANPDQLARGWEQFAEAVKCTHLRDFSSDLVRRQIEALPAESTFVGSKIQEAYTEGIMSAKLMGERWWFGYSSGNATDLTARLQVLEKEEGVEGVRGMFEDWLKTRRMMVHDLSSVTFLPSNAPTELVQEARSFVSSFNRLGDEEMRQQAESLADRLSKVEVKQYLEPSDPLDKHASMRFDEVSLIPHQLTLAEIRPSRMVELAFLEQIYAWLGSFLMLFFVLCCGFETYRRAASVRGMARGLMPLLSMRDRVYLGGLGVALPWLFWWGVTRLTPLGMRDLGINDPWRSFGWIIQTIAALVLMWVMLVQTGQWIWGKRGAFLGFGSRVGWLGWVVAGITAMAIPAAGMLRFLSLSDEQSGFFLLGAAGAGSVGLLWLLWVGGMNLFTPRSSALRANLVSRTLLPWSLVSLGLLVLSAGVLWQAEKSWYRADPVFPSWTSDTFRNAFDERVVTELQQGLTEAFAEEP